MITLSQAVQWPAEVDPAITDLKSKASQGIVSAYDIPPTTAPLEIVLMCGKPGSGKSTIFQTVFAPLGYVHVNLDTEKSTEKCKKKATATLQSRTSIVVDQTFPSKKSRADYVQLARSFNIPIRIICVETPISVALHLNTIRSWLYDIPHVPTIAYRLFDKQFEKPTLNEGFSEVINLPFKITVADPVLLKAIQWSTERG
jgi:bifunctional polynucleotide phosphatase/kinase